MMSPCFGERIWGSLFFVNGIFGPYINFDAAIKSPISMVGIIEPVGIL